MPDLVSNNKKTIPSSKKVSARLQAVWWIVGVIKDGRSVNELLALPSNHQLSSSEVAFAKQILFGSLRYYHQLKAILDQLLEKPLKEKDLDIYSILLSGVYQLKYLSVPDHAAISESVDLAQKMKKKWASGLINAVLRGYQRRNEAIAEKLGHAATYQFSHPNWIINQLKDDWANDYQYILEQNNRRAPMFIRVNTQHNDLFTYQEKLNKVSIESERHTVAQDALLLLKPCDVFSLPGFSEGDVTVQDAAPQLVVEMMGLEPDLNALDGCAAPGGKTTHILQREPTTRLVSIEKSSSRLKKVTEVLSRFNMSDNSYKVDLLNVDFLDYDTWWDGQLFDRILIDVPCSASGVIRRNPDIKVHRKKTDMKALITIQKQILHSAWKMLKPGGKLVYATCSVFKDENENQIKLFLKENEATLLTLPSDLHQVLANEYEQSSGIGYQVFPGQKQMDGFYFCGLEKPQ